MPKVIAVGSVAREQLESAQPQPELNVVYAATSEEARDLARSTPPACFICDLSAPGEGGAWLLRQLRRKRNEAALVPFLFLLEEEDDETDVEWLLASEDRLLRAPHDPAVILRTVRGLILISARLREGYRSTCPPRSSASAQLSGSLELAGGRTLLSLLEMQHKTAELQVVAGAQSLVIALSGGAVLRATRNGADCDASSVVRDLLELESGEFTLRELAAEPAPDGSPKVAALVASLRTEDLSNAAPPQPSSVAVPPPARTSTSLSPEVVIEELKAETEAALLAMDAEDDDSEEIQPQAIVDVGSLRPKAAPKPSLSPSLSVHPLKGEQAALVADAEVESETGAKRHSAKRRAARRRARRQ